MKTELLELQGQFEAERQPTRLWGLTPHLLRRIRILADFSNAQLAHLAEFMEFEEAPQDTVVVTQGGVGDAMYLVVSGELRARSMASGRETVLATFSAGDFFGDMALFDMGPRSADVVANVDSTLLKIGAASFYRLIREAPELATPFLQMTTRTLSARIRAGNKQISQLVEELTPERV